MQYLMNTWYQAGWSSEVEESTLLARTLLDEPLVFYRDSNGKVNALMDRCPHKFAPLSAGCVKGDSVVCGYHGLTFDCSGDCVIAPTQLDNPPRRAAVHSYPARDQWGFLWIWMGFERQLGMETRAKSDLKWIGKCIEQIIKKNAFFYQ